MVQKSASKARELGAFLRIHRERMRDGQGKIRDLKNRRTPGLRREDVAELAGIGVTWYTWLEQGRPNVRPSIEVLTRLGSVLELSPIEMKYVFSLADRTLPDEQLIFRETVPESIKHLIDHLSFPASVGGQRADHLYGNAALKEWIANFDSLATERRNWLDYLYMEPNPSMILIPEWESLGKRIIAEYRNNLGMTPYFFGTDEVVNRLKNECKRFARDWSAHEVSETSSLQLSIKHPAFGRVDFERIVLMPAEAPTLKVIIFRPLLGFMPDRERS